MIPKSKLSFQELKPLQSLIAGLFFKHRRVCLMLPRQEGKTELGVRLLHDITRRPFTSTATFMAKDQKSGKKATREKFMRLFDSKLFDINTENVVLKQHPTSIIFMQSVDKDPDRMRGGTYQFIHWSEVAFSKIEQGFTILDVFERIVQPTLRKTNGYVYLESTPNGKNGWMEMFNNAKDLGLHPIKFSLSDLVAMGIVPEEEYHQIASTTQPDVFRQEYECEFVTFQGKIYKEFNEKLHVRKLDPPKDWMTVGFAIDWGYEPSATCILFAYVKDGVIHIFDEHYALKELAIHTAEVLQAKQHAYNVRLFAGVADHEADRIEELNRRGIPCGKANKVNVFGARLEIKRAVLAKSYNHRPKM